MWAIAGIVVVSAAGAGFIWWAKQSNKPAAEIPQPPPQATPAPSRVGASPATPAASPTPQVSTAGLGDAKFGFYPAAVETALRQKLVFSKEAMAARMETLECAYASISNLPGVKLRFEKGRFTAVIIDKPMVTTLSGLKVGDRETAVIAKLSSDPTYRRNPNRYSDKVIEIYVGKADFIGGPTGGRWQGTLAKFTSHNGVISMIEAGEAGYVGVDEHHEDCK
jgi:hypothetical protein